MFCFSDIAYLQTYFIFSVSAVRVLPPSWNLKLTVSLAFYKKRQSKLQRWIKFLQKSISIILTREIRKQISFKTIGVTMNN